MPSALVQLDGLLRRFALGPLNPYELLESLLADELESHEKRCVTMALMTARLTTIKTLESSYFAFRPFLDWNRVLSLARLGFIELREVVHFLSPPGTGRSHPAIALGQEAVKVEERALRHPGQEGHLTRTHRTRGPPQVSPALLRP
jgi:DNA replication protein DnaC